MPQDFAEPLIKVLNVEKWNKAISNLLLTAPDEIAQDPILHAYYWTMSWSYIFVFFFYFIINCEVWIHRVII